MASALPEASPTGDELKEKKLSEYKTIIQNLGGRIISLQESAFTLANYYFVSQAVVFTALSGNSSLVCRDVWFPLFLSLVPGLLNLFAFFKIGQECIETMISQKEYKIKKRNLELEMAGQILEQMPNEERERERLTVILYICMGVFVFLAAVIAVGCLWMLCRESILSSTKRNV